MKNNTKCDNCKQDFYGNREARYCYACYEKLADELSVAEERIKQLEEEIKNLEKQ